MEYNCPKCHVISDIGTDCLWEEYNEICEYSDLETCRPSWAKVLFGRMVCPVCKNETEFEIGRQSLDKRPKRVDRLCI